MISSPHLLLLVRSRGENKCALISVNGVYRVSVSLGDKYAIAFWSPELDDEDCTITGTF